MRRTRIINAVLATIFLILTLSTVRNFISPRNVAADVRASGTVVFNDDAVNAGAKSADYIFLSLFGSLTLVFAWRAIKPANPPAA